MLPGLIQCAEHSSSTTTLQADVSYTTSQRPDALRHLVYREVGRLCRERKRLLQQMAEHQDVGEIALQEVRLRLSEVSDLAEQLRTSGADEYNTHIQFSLAFSCKVCLLPVPLRRNFSQPL